MISHSAGKIRKLDPKGLLLPIGIASDGTELCKEQSVTPMYVVNNALPQDEKRKRIHWILVRPSAERIGREL